MNFSSSSSFSSTFPRSVSIIERPHSSPPYLGGGLFLSRVGGSPMKMPLDGETDCVFNSGSTSNQSESSLESCDVDTLGMTVDTIGESTAVTHIRRIKSTGNLSEIAALGHKFCYKNLEIIRNKERLTQANQAEAEKKKKENCSKSEFDIFSTK